MRRTNKHTITWVKNYTADPDGILVPATADYSLLLDIPKRLAERFGRNMPACAVYELSAVRLWLTYQPSETLPSWSRLIGGSLRWMEPTNERIKALRQAAREFFSQREAAYGQQRSLQFYPRLTTDPVNPTPAFGTSPYTALHMSRRADGRYFTLAPIGGATDAENWAILREYNLQNPPLAEPTEQTGSLQQDTRLYDMRAYEPIESVRTWRAWISHRMQMMRAEAAGFTTPIVETWVDGNNTEVFASWRDQPNQEAGLVLGPLDVMLGQLQVFPERAYPKIDSSQSTYWDTANQPVGLVVEADVTGWREMK